MLKEGNHRLGAYKKTLRKAMWKLKKEWKLPTLKKKSKINKGECLSSLGKEKEVSINERYNKRQKSIQKKIYRVTNIVFWYQW